MTWRFLLLLLPLLVSGLALGGCRVVRYPPEGSLPRPVPDVPPEVEAEVAAQFDPGKRESARLDVFALVVELGRGLVGKPEVVVEGVAGRADIPAPDRGRPLFPASSVCRHGTVGAPRRLRAVRRHPQARPSARRRPQRAASA